MFKLQQILYYIIQTPQGYQAKFDPNDGLYVQEKIARVQNHPIIHQGKLLDHSLADIVLQEVDSANQLKHFNPAYLEQRLSEIY